MMTMTIASASVFSTSLMESEITVVVSTAMMPLSPAGTTSQFREHGAAALVDVQRIGVRELLHADADGVAALERLSPKVQAGVVVLRAQFGAANVLQQHNPGPLPARHSLARVLFDFRMMFSNWFGSVSRPSTRTAIW